MHALFNTRAKSATTIVCVIAMLTGCSYLKDGSTNPAQVTNMASSSTSTVKVEDLTVEQIKTIAEEGFIYGLPLAMNYAVMNEYAINKNTSQFKAPFNHIKNEPRVYTYKDTTILSPNSDTPYSVAWLDLRSEPVVITVPEVEMGRYYSVQLIDGNLYNDGYIGSRATGNKTGSYAVVGPNWQGNLPEGINKIFHSTTPFMLTIFRTQLLNSEDMPNVEKVQAGYAVQTLSAFQNKPEPITAPNIDFQPATSSGVKTHFWRYLSAALNYIPESTEDKAIRDKLAMIGIVPGKEFDIDNLSPEQQKAMAAGMKAGNDKVTEFVANGATDINGWQVGSMWGDEDYFAGDWLKRAGGGRAGIYGNDAAESIYLLSRMDNNGMTLDGSKHNYTLTFPAGSLPPVNAFWSVTMYYGDSQLLVENPINRYLINSPMLPSMKKNTDGSLTIYIQNTSPGKDKEPNWLPAPDGPIYLALRMYWPKPASGPSSVLPLGKGSWNPPGIVIAD